MAQAVSVMKFFLFTKKSIWSDWPCSFLPCHHPGEMCGQASTPIKLWSKMRLSPFLSPPDRSHSRRGDPDVRAGQGFRKRFSHNLASSLSCTICSIACGVE